MMRRKIPRTIIRPMNKIALCCLCDALNGHTGIISRGILNRLDACTDQCILRGFLTLDNNVRFVYVYLGTTFTCVIFKAQTPKKEKVRRSWSSSNYYFWLWCAVAENENNTKSMDKLT
jgi:hypothetical protein